MNEQHATIYENSPPQVLRSIEELDLLLADSAMQARARGTLNVIFLNAANDDHLTLVVGGDETVVGFNYGNGEPPYYVSKGEADGDEPVLIAYVGLTHHTEFLRRWVIPMHLGLRAAKEFLATGQRPKQIAWVEL